MERDGMDEELAKTVLAGITLVGAVVWLIGFEFLRASARKAREYQRQRADDGGVADEQSEGWYSGTADVEGDASALAARAAAVLARGNLATFGLVRIVEKTDDRVRFDRADGGPGKRPATQRFRRGEFRFIPLGSGRTRVEWAVDPGGTGPLLFLGGLFQAAGLVTLVVMCSALYTSVATSPDPAVRWQTLQMIQVVHLLWPPFLMGGLYRYLARAVAAQFDAMAHNLPYTEV
jgi:hypothetical protein